MNKRVHRLVFDRKRGMRVPAAEHVRGCGKAASGQTRAVSVAVSALVATLGGAAGMADARTIAGSVTRSAAAWDNRTIVRDGNGTALNANLPFRSGQFSGGDMGRFSLSYTTDGLGDAPNRLTVDQQDKLVTINWDTYNLGRGYAVRYNQPDSKSVAYNKIWDANPSVILGKITANGHVILENTSGVIFGPSARVETQRFVATALSLSQETLKKGIDNITDGSAVFGSDADKPNGSIVVELGAEIRALAGGQVMLFAPKVYNKGRIETPRGQAILAAGKKVYLMTSTDATQRGLMVAVDAFKSTNGSALPEGTNTVENAQRSSYYVNAAGETVDVPAGGSAAGLTERINAVVAEKGIINLVGMSIRQNGVLTATTAVKGENGAIYIHASASKRDSTSVNPLTQLTDKTIVADRLGDVEFGAGSVTEVRPDASGATQTVADSFYRSRIDVMGNDIRVHSGATISAQSGDINLRAAAGTVSADGTMTPVFGTGSDVAVKDNSRLLVESGAVLDVSGVRNVSLDGVRNQLSSQLFKIELADSPVQRDGVLYRQRVSFDANDPITIANVLGFYNKLQRSAQELSTTGGNLRLEGMGTVAVADGAQVKFGGGSASVSPAVIQTSVLRLGNRLVTLDQAQAGVRYDELLSSTAGSRPTSAYTQGYDGGSAIVGGASKTVVGLSGFDGDVVVGDKQRASRLSGTYTTDRTGPKLTRPDVLSTKPYLESQLRPLAASLSVGREYGVAPSNYISKLAVAPTYDVKLNLTKKNEDGSDAPIEMGSADYVAVFDALPSATVLSAQGLSNAHLSQLSLVAQHIEVQDGSNISLRSAGLDGLKTAEQPVSLNLAADDAIYFGGKLRADGGKVNILSRQGDIVLGANAELDVSGRKVDERGVGGSEGMSISGGAVNLTAAHGITLPAGSLIDVSAGAWRNIAGTVQKGNAGSIDIKANTVAPELIGQEARGQVTLGGSLRGFDFSKGGTVSVAGMSSLTIGGADSAGGMSLDPAVFGANGFGTISLSAQGDVTVKAGAQIKPVLRNYDLSVVRGRATESNMVFETSLANGLRQGMNINLTATAPVLVDVVTAAVTQGSVKVEQGAAIDAGAGGSIALKAFRSVEVDGNLTSRGGTVALSISGSRGSASVVATPDDSPDAIGYLADQVVRLGASSTIDVSGIGRTYRQSNGKTVGTVLGGGTVKLNDNGQTAAVRGRVVTEAGSKIDISGASGALTIERGIITSSVSRGAGTLSVGSTDGFLLESEVVASRPDASVAGGQLILSVSREGGYDTVKSIGTPYTATERAIVVSASPNDLTQFRGSADTGQGHVAASMINGAGFDRVELRADDRVVLTQGVSLKSTANGGENFRSLSLNTQAIEVGQGAHSVSAQHVALGAKSILPQNGAAAFVAPQASGGDASLDVNAGLIEVWGHSAFRGADDVRLNATLDAQGGASRTNGEVRFIGRNLPNTTALTGRLNFAKNLTLSAGQVYASTLSKFLVQGDLGTSSLTVSPPSSGASSSATPLSALASLTLQATDITINGTVRQPFGTIAINAENTPVLGQGSELSVSGFGITVPVGTTINQRDWVYSVIGNGDGKVDTTLDTTLKLNGLPVSKSILVSGKGITIDASSQIKAQGGGDIIAPEFVSGAGGTKDTTSRANVYVILPGYSYEFAPYDTEIRASTKATGTALTEGDRVYVGSDSGVLAKGFYTLLPAKYASLPGAVIVSETTLSAGQTLKSAIQNDDGSVIVSGYRTAVGTSINGGNDNRLALTLEPEATFRAKSADSTVTSLNALLASQSDGTAVRPGDAGRVSLQATQGAFNWDARYDLSAADGFVGGQLDLAMANMKVVADVDPKAGPDGSVSAKALAATGAASILLGGVRTDSSSGTQVAVSTSTLDVATDVTVGKELVFVAKEALLVADGKTVRTSQSGPATSRALTIVGEGAALVVSNQANTDVRRDLSGVTGDSNKTLTLGKGVTLAGASVQIDSSGQVLRQGDLTLDTQALGIGTKRLAVGGASDKSDALVVDAASVNSLARLQLRGYQGIDLVGNVQLGGVSQGGALQTKDLVLDTANLRGVAAAGVVGTQKAQVLAEHVTLRNTSGGTVDPKAVGNTALTILARPPVADATAEGVTMGPGAQRLAFQRAEIATTGDIVMRGTSSTTAQGDLMLNAARVTAARGAAASVDSAQVLTVAAIDKTKSGDAQVVTARTLGNVVGAGASLGLSGQRVVQAGTVDLASGKITVTGRGDGSSADTVVFESGSTTKAAGWVAQAGGTWTAVANAGSIKAVAQKGDVVVRGTLDVSAPVSTTAGVSSGVAGAITLIAIDQTSPLGSGSVVIGDQAKLLGSAFKNSESGIVTVDAARVLRESERGAAASAQATAGLNALVKAINDGGNHREVDVRIREGNQALSTGLTAARVLLSADGGKLTLSDGAVIDASAARGGVVQLSAKGDVTMSSGASIDASSSAVGANGGDVLVSSSEGLVDLQTGALINTAGDSAGDGRIVLRAQAAGTTSVKITKPGATLKAGEITAESVKVFTTTGSVNMTSASALSIGTSGDVIAYAKGITAANANVIKSSLGWANTDSRFHVQTGIEIRTDGDFTLGTDWNLGNLRSGGEPIALTVRAKGNVNINANLSDGFSTAGRAPDTATAPTTTLAGDGASMRLVAGADTGSAALLKTSSTVAKDLTVAADKVVRTTSGSIEVAASQDVVLKGNTPSGSTLVRPAAIYVAGKLAGDPAGLVARDTDAVSNWEQFTQQGGRLEVGAGRNVVAPAISELFGNWLMHSGRDAASVTWWTTFDSFRQGLGSMGGGNLRVVAGNDIRNVGVASTTTGRTVQDSETGVVSQVVTNGGDVLVRAGGNVSGGAYLLSRGQGAIEAGANVTTGDTYTNANGIPKMGLILGLMDGQWAVRANGDVAMTAIYNPTIVSGLTVAPSKGAQPRVTANMASSFFTYGSDSGLSIASVAGDVNWRSPGTSPTALGQALNKLMTAYVPLGEQVAISLSRGSAHATWWGLLAPPKLALTATSGNVNLVAANPIELFPSASGNLTVYAGGDLNLGAAGAATSLALVDADVSAMAVGTVFNPAGSDTTGDALKSLTSSRYAKANSETPVLSVTLHQDDATPARIHAEGDINFSGGSSINVSKAADVSAGEDINSPDIRTIHFRSTDVTRVVAGRDIVGVTSSVNDTKRLSGLIQVGGIGELQVEAGRNLDLVTSGGIETVGNLYNSALPSQSASIRLAAGATRSVDVNAFEARYLQGDAQLRNELVVYVAQTLALDAKALSYGQALAYFGQLSRAHQVSFADRVMRDQFVRTYLSAAARGVDVVWAFVAANAGVSVDDTGSTAYQQYLSGQRALISYMRKVMGAQMSYSEALAAYRALDNTGKAELVDKRGTLGADVAAAFLVAGTAPDYAQMWQDRVAAAIAVMPAGAAKPSAADYQSALFAQFRDDVLMGEIKRLGNAAGAVADSSNALFAARRSAVREVLWSSIREVSELSGMGTSFVSEGDINLAGSKAQTRGMGDFTGSGIDLFAPGGRVLVGYNALSANDRKPEVSVKRGLITNGGSIRSFSDGDFQVNSQKAFVIGTGDLTVYSANGNIDSGRGSNTDVAVSDPVLQRLSTGEVVVTTPPPVSGSGIGVVKDAQGKSAGQVNLLAPRGEVRALDAFIQGPEVNVPGPVVGADNIKSATPVGPAAAPVAVNLAVNTGLGSESAAGNAQSEAAKSRERPRDASSVLTVDVLGAGEVDSALPPTAAGKPDAKSDTRTERKADAKACAGRPDCPGK